MAAAEHPALPPVDGTLAYERERGPRTGLLAIVAGIAVLVSNIALQAIYSDIPRVPLIDGLRDAAGQDLGRPGLLTDKVLFYDDKAVPLLLVSVLQAIGVIATGFALTYLHRAATVRGGTVPRIARLLAMAGAACAAVGYLMLTITATILSSDFAGQRDQGTEAAHDALRSGALFAGQVIGFVGTLALALAFVLIALGAMRVGLLTRFMGVLGILVGVLLLFPLGPSAFVVQGFWLAALGMLFLRRWPRGMPPAWESGRAQPWPTQQQLREARRGGGAPAPAGPPATEAPRADAPSPAAAARKKRKRRG